MVTVKERPVQEIPVTERPAAERVAAEKPILYPWNLLPARDTALFTLMATLAFILFDMTIGHAIILESDPYWTYWVTQAFLAAAIFGLGTAWGGIGEGRGAWLSLIYTILTGIYYWSFSPVGLPQHPFWLDTAHAWTLGLPIHFGTAYLAYLTALWLWRRSVHDFSRPADDALEMGSNIFVTGIVITVVAGILGNITLGQFAGFSWFLSRFFLTIPFLMMWSVAAGRDAYAAVAGGFILALLWAAYGHYLQPAGLPNPPMRFLSPEPSGAIVRWLGYREMWLIQFPIYIVSMVVILLLDSRSFMRRRV